LTWLSSGTVGIYIKNAIKFESLRLALPAQVMNLCSKGCTA